MAWNEGDPEALMRSTTITGAPESVPDATATTVPCGRLGVQLRARSRATSASAVDRLLSVAPAALGADWAAVAPFDSALFTRPDPEPSESKARRRRSTLA